MDFDFFFVIAVIIFFGFTTVDNSRDIKAYFDKPYCEKVKLGTETISKCWKVVPVDPEQKDK